MLSKYQLSRIETLGIIRPMLCLLSSLKNEVKPRKKKKKRKEKKVCAISELFLCLPFKMYSLLATLRQKRQLKSKSLLILFRKFLWRQRTIPSKEGLPRFHDQASGSNVHEDNFSYVLLWFSLIFFFSERMEGDENFKSLQYPDKEWLIPHIFDLFAGNDIGKSRFYLSL